jgi:hypothetical protein
MVDINQFSFSIASRHPKFLNAYDAASHSYKSEYISPTQWHLKLSFDIEDELRRKNRELEALQRPQPPIEDERPGRHPRPQHELNELEEEMEALNKAIADLEQTIQVHDFWFRVERISSGVSHTPSVPTLTVISSQDSPVNAMHPILPLTQQGRYQLTSFVRRKNNPAIQPTELAKHMTLKDILICTIGDSYACGEGNPDEPLTPTNEIRDYADMLPLTTLLAIRDDFEYTPELELAAWQEPLAHRSHISAPTLAAERVNGVYSDLQVVSTHVSFARSGAGLQRGLLGPNLHNIDPRNGQPWLVGPNLHPRSKRRNRRFHEPVIETDEFSYLDDLTQKGQIDEMQAALGSRQADFLVVSIGGNDSGWIPGFIDIITPDNGITAAHVFSKVSNFIENNIEDHIVALNERISLMPLQPRYVLLMLYPNGFFGAGAADNPQTKRNCGIFDTANLVPDWFPMGEDDSLIGIDIEEAEIIKNLAILLNAKLRESVANQNIRNKLINQLSTTNQRHFAWHIVDNIDRDFETHGYCSDSPWFVGAGESFLKQSDWYGLLHPNLKGQEAYAKRIAEKIRAILNDHLEEFRPKEFQRVGNPTGGSNPSTTTRIGVA